MLVLPAPLGPMIANSSSGSTVKLTPLTALTLPKDSETLSKVSTLLLMRPTASDVGNA